MVEVVECQEFGIIEIGIDRLLVDGELVLDSRIVDKKFLNFSLVKGQIVFRADKHVGLIPLNGTLAIRVRPRVHIANLAYMIVKSGIAPVAIPDFSRGYLPQFEVGDDLEKTYCQPLVRGAERVLAAGLMKTYVAVAEPPPWRGRLLVSDTIKKHRARNVRYRGEFEYRTLTYGGSENIALKYAVRIARDWLVANERRNPLLARANRVISELHFVPDFEGRLGSLLHDIARSASRLPPHFAHYRDPLWTAYLMLQNSVPNLAVEGFVTLDSMVVDLSKVFEAFLRRALLDRATAQRWRIVNGDDVIYPLFSDGSEFRVKPDIVITQDGKPIAILDAKYKPDPKEQDRYEVLSFMDAIGVQHGGFVCPAQPGTTSHYMGLTAGGKSLSLLRFDLASPDLEIEADKLFENVVKLANGRADFG